MPLVTMKQMIQHASHHGYTLGGFSLENLDDIAAVLDAAQTCRAPVLLDISQRRHSAADSGMILAAAEHAARHASIPVGLLATQVTQADAAVGAIRDGSTGLSIDLSRHGAADNMRQARSFVQLAGGCGIALECLIAGVVEDPDTDMLQSFAEQSGVDLLGLELGDTTAGQSSQQLVRAITAIKQRVPMSLALSGASGLDETSVRTLQDAGVALMHFSTGTPAMGSPVQTGSTSHTSGPPRSRDVIRQYVLERMLALGCAERATDVLNDCSRWEPVEHVIVFNVETQGGLDIDTILARGREVLGEIPGVRYVYTGQAVQSNAAYQFCWLVRFVHPAVIDSYREYPTHKKFADELFRPIAPTRMSIDFYLTTDRGASQSLCASDLQPGRADTATSPDRLTAV